MGSLFFWKFFHGRQTAIPGFRDWRWRAYVLAEGVAELWSCVPNQAVVGLHTQPRLKLLQDSRAGAGPVPGEIKDKSGEGGGHL